MGPGHRPAQRPPPRHTPNIPTQPIRCPLTRITHDNPTQLHHCRRRPGRRHRSTDPARGRVRRQDHLLGEEPHRPYERPPLSKDYLQGKADRDSIFAHPEPWYADHAVELRLGTAVISLDPT